MHHPKETGDDLTNSNLDPYVVDADNSDGGAVRSHIAPEPGRERGQVVDEVTKAWEMADEPKQPLQLVVSDCDVRGRAYKSEMRQLFPEGTKHLPEMLR